jgi:2-polyprenyl-6-methoxyphenol hydroxylase-like FAD-dependent oxidoreductase
MHGKGFIPDCSAFHHDDERKTMAADSATCGDHAIVLGGSFAGLVAARVLSGHYRQVTVVERDALPAGPVNRRGVPQGRFSHILHGRGLHLLEELFPGFVADLIAAGVPTWQEGAAAPLKIWLLGHRLADPSLPPSDDRPLQMCFASRPMLEGAVRRRVCDIDNVQVIDDTTVTSLTTTEASDRITGVRIATPLGAESTLDADLVVDATGRGSRTPVMLDELGYGRPVEDELKIRLTYRTQPLRLPERVDRSVMVNPKPGQPKLMALIGYENDAWLFTVGGVAGVEPPEGFTRMLTYARDFVPAEVLQIVGRAQPFGECVTYRVPSNRWRRYDKMAQLPEGLLVVGDAVCSFNPIYGQGMTIAAEEALVLDRCLDDGPEGLPRRFFRAITGRLAIAWQMSVGSDLALPEIEGKRSLSMRLTNAYMARVIATAAADPVVSGQFLRVVGMVDSPLTLIQPSTVMRVGQMALRR